MPLSADAGYVRLQSNATSAVNVVGQRGYPVPQSYSEAKALAGAADKILNTPPPPPIRADITPSDQSWFASRRSE
jgi:hypothetical protein